MVGFYLSLYRYYEVDEIINSFIPTSWQASPPASFKL